MSCRDFFWAVFGVMSLLCWMEGVNKVANQLFNIEAAVRLQTAQQTYLLERIKLEPKR